MKKMKKKDIWLFVGQLILLQLIMLSPGLVTYVTSGSGALASESLWITVYWLAPVIAIYLINFYIIIPLLWFRKRYWLFGVANVVMIALLNFHTISYNIYSLPEYVRAGYASFVTISLIINLLVIGVALSIRYFMRQSEQRQQEVEAELAWLKNQINPHFLFNTLNNISCLAQIDGDLTQEAVMELSDLLRYAMYDTNKPKVNLDGEVKFMQNYIELMKLRCNDMTKVDYHFSIANYQQEVAPLLFISLIENAFKHGVNSNAPATIDISLTQLDDKLVFCCDNTNNPKPSKDRSGSGIGLDNTRRRLNLIYPGRYTWEQSISSDNIYHIKISISL